MVKLSFDSKQYWFINISLPLEIEEALENLTKFVSPFRFKIMFVKGIILLPCVNFCPHIYMLGFLTVIGMYHSAF